VNPLGVDETLVYRLTQIFVLPSESVSAEYNIVVLAEGIDCEKLRCQYFSSVPQ
jgi:hypothetical protein